jgi:hypothetical protein
MTRFGQPTGPPLLQQNLLDDGQHEFAQTFAAILQPAPDGAD